MTDDIARRPAPAPGEDAEARTPVEMPKGEDKALRTEAHVAGVAAVARALDQAE